MKTIEMAGAISVNLGGEGEEDKPKMLTWHTCAV